LRDAKLGEIGEGTSEMQRRVIARALLTGGLPTL
jgi:alkylation response protein AidB-like acyl-CoA dehydrogenase